MAEFVNEIIEQIWKDRYCKNNETLDENYRRVAKYCSKNSEEEKQFYLLMKNKMFYPAGRTMSNSGIGRDLTMNNCFVAPQIKDDLTDIFEKVKLGARTHQKGGGIGYDFSQLRPKGSPTSNDAIASGAVSFMDVFNAQTDTILQGNRRGANMGVMNIYSLDIEDFINVKSTDNTRLQHFNLSVMVDNDFIEAVKCNKSIFLHFPVYDQNGRILKDESKWIYQKEVNAKYLWDLIIKKAYDNGEPGIFFYDNLNGDNNIWYIENIVCTNPCFTGDMKLLTENGYKTFEELCDKYVNLINKNGEITKGKVWCSGNKDTIQLTLSNKQKIKCTPNHIFMTNDGTECKARDLLGKRLKLYKINKISPKVISIKQNGKEKVYDFTEPNTHWGVVENVIVHNCSEYVSGTLYGNNPTTNEPLNPDEYGGACNLGSLVLYTYVKKPFTKDAYLDFDELKNAIYTAIRFLDNIIDINKFPDQIYKNYQEAFRTIGLGDTGIANMLTMLNLKYNSKKAREFVDKLKNFITFNAYLASIELAKEKGAFPFLDKEKFIQSGFIQKHLNLYPEWQEVVDGIEEYGIRNAKLISIAPAGTMSIVFGNNCSSGIEPIFSLEYDRKVKIGGQSEDNVKTIKMQDYSYYLWQNTKKNNIVKKDVFVTALDMSVEDHLEMLKVVAFHTDMSVSKTINIPIDYSFEQTKDVYMKAWEYGIKGCTIFRPNELRQGIISTPKEKKNIKSKFGRGDIISPSDDLIGFKKTITNGCGHFTLHDYFDDVTGEPFETWITLGSKGGCERNLEFISRLISIALRSGIPIEVIIDQAKSIKPCKAYTDRTKLHNDTSKGTSCASAIGWTLEEMNNKIQNYCFAEFDDEESNEAAIMNYPCPECGEELSFEGGCNICKFCGWSKCS